MRGLAGAALVVAVALTLAAAALAGPPLRVGAVEDAANGGDPGPKMDLARLAGFDSVRMTAQWSSGVTSPSSGELTNLQNAAAAAAARGIGPIVSIYNAGSSSTPADDASRAQFVQYATAVVRALPSVTTFIVGNEPNSNYYWLPQFDVAGGDAAAQADYGKLVSLLGEAFGGTAQAGSALPILYGEFGVESLIPAVKLSV